MQRYLKQLHSDLRHIQSQPPEVDDSFYDLPFSEQVFIEGEETEYMTLQEYFDIPYEALPTPNLLTNDQIKALLKALEKMLVCHNIHCTWPKGIHNRTKYRILRDSWHVEMIGIFPMADYQMQFCGHDPASCPFGYHKCECLHVELEALMSDDDDMMAQVDENEEDALPF